MSNDCLFDWGSVPGGYFDEYETRHEVYLLGDEILVESSEYGMPAGWQTENGAMHLFTIENGRYVSARDASDFFREHYASLLNIDGGYIKEYISPVLNRDLLATEWRAVDDQLGHVWTDYELYYEDEDIVQLLLDSCLSISRFFKSEEDDSIASAKNCFDYSLFCEYLERCMDAWDEGNS